MVLKSQANLISVVVLILVILVTVVILWNVVYSTTKKTSEKVSIDIFLNSIELTESKTGFIGDVKIKVKRISGKEEIDSIKFIFYDEDGKSHLVERKKENYELPKELETKSFKFRADEINSNGEKIVKIDAVPVFGEKIGIGDSEDKLSKISLSDEDDKKYLKELGLISLWKFDDNYQDSVGVNHGTAVNGPVFVDGKIGKAVKFDGVDDFIRVPNSQSLNTSEITISSWISLNDINNNQQTLISKIIFNGLPLLSSGYEIGFSWLNPGRVTLFSRSGISNTNLEANNVITQSNNWYHITTTIGPSGRKIYVNGELKASDNIPNVKSNALPIHIGVRGNPFGAPQVATYFEGKIDELQIFNSSLTETEVLSLYNNGND